MGVPCEVRMVPGSVKQNSPTTTQRMALDVPVQFANQIILGHVPIMEKVERVMELKTSWGLNTLDLKSLLKQ